MCGSADLKLISKKGILEKGGEILNFNNSICKNCGLVFLNPQPGMEEYAAIYEKYEKNRHGLQSPEEILGALDFGNNEKGGSVHEFIKDYLGAGRTVLDIGCATGQISDYLKRSCGCDVQAVEPSKLFSEAVNQKLGINVFNGSFDDFYKTNQKKFNVLMMHHVFEHFTDPAEKLAQFKNLLLPDGVVYIEVPDVTSFSKPVNVFFDYLHPFNYSPKTLKELVYKNGYKIVKVNKAKRYRLQIIIAPKESVYMDMGDDAYLMRGGFGYAMRFINKKRIVDAIRSFLRPVVKL